MKINPEINVLYYSDDLNRVGGFNAFLNKFFTVFTIQSSNELEKFVNADINIIIIDCEMLSTSVMNLMAILTKKYPEHEVILSTSNSVNEILNDGIDVRKKYRYLKKPCNESTVIEMIQACFYLSKLKEEEKELIDELKKKAKEIRILLKEVIKI